MQTKKPTGSPEWIDPDDAPPLTAGMLDEAEVFEGDKFIRRARGRPATGGAKEVVSFRLDRDVLARLRQAGPGWHSQVNTMLRVSLNLDAMGDAPAWAKSGDFKEKTIEVAEKGVESEPPVRAGPRKRALSL